MMKHHVTDIVVVNDSAHIDGGSTQVALTSAIALARSGLRVTVFAAVGPAMPLLLDTPNLRVVLTDQRAIVDDPSRVRAAVQGIWNRPAARMFADTLAGLDPLSTVVHAHGWTKALSSSVMRTAMDAHFPIVITLHEYFTACPIGSFYNHRRKEICHLTAMSPGCLIENCDPRSYRDKVYRIVRQEVASSTGKVPTGIRDFITISDLSEAVLRPYLPATARLHRVNNPIESTHRPKTNVAGNADFTYVGRLSPEKGAPLFARAAHAAGVRAVFIGDGECAGEVRRENPDAEITGWLSHGDVTERLAHARALVLPSLWYENSPLVVSEAAALGVPAIVADSSAAKERVADGVTGRLFRGGDGISLTAALRLLSDGPLSAALGSEAYKRYWESPQAMDHHVVQLTDVYEIARRNA
jgi:glycosyltransferase involved in cell wall biosynthesis